MIGLGVNCSKCGQTFELASQPSESTALAASPDEPRFTVGSNNTDDTILDSDDRQANDFVLSLSLLSKGFRLLSRGWTLLAISLAVLLPLSTAGRLEAVPQELVPVFAIAIRLAMLFVGLSCLLYVAGQACCVFAHPSGSECRKSLANACCCLWLERDYELRAHQ